MRLIKLVEQHSALINIDEAIGVVHYYKLDDLQGRMHERPQTLQLQGQNSKNFFRCSTLNFGFLAEHSAVFTMH
jgi:hypothetical protein